MSNDGVSQQSDSFRFRLLGAVLLNLLLKVFTFSLSTLLTRLIAPSISGAGFSYFLYFDTAYFLAREGIRCANARHRVPKLSSSSESTQEGSKSTKHESTEATARIANAAALTLPMFGMVALLLEGLAACGVGVLPSLIFSSSAPGDDLALGTTSLPWISSAPELLVFLSVAVMLLAEPHSSLALSLDLPRLTVTAEFVALVARLLASFAALALAGLLHTRSGALEIGATQIRTAQLCYAVALFAYSAAFTAYFTLTWVRGTGSNSFGELRAALRREKSDVATPWLLVTPTRMIEELKENASLFRPFFFESVLRLALTEGERFALEHFGSLGSKGMYDLVSNVGSLIARLVFRVWEQGCFARWSKDVSDGNTRSALALLQRMLRLSLLFSGAFPLFGPPLAATALRVVYSSRWATPGAVTALQLYCFLIPLMAWNGLLEAFLRAASTVSELSRLQRVMVVESLVYITACYLSLRTYGGGSTGSNGSSSTASENDHAVSVLILSNIVNMLLRCVLSIVLISRTSSVKKENLSSALRWSGILGARLVGVWIAMYILSRVLPLFIVAFVLPIVYGGAILYLDDDLRRDALSVWTRLTGRFRKTTKQS